MYGLIERCYRLISLGEMTPDGLAVMPEWKPEDFIIQEWVIDALNTGRSEQARKALENFIRDTMAETEIMS